MIAVDTNILVRYAVKDDPQQTVAATEFILNQSCFVLKTVLLEFVWVLSSSSGYGLSRVIVTERMRHILGLATVSVEEPAHVKLSLEWYEKGMDFADALHLSSSSVLTGFVTFDKKFSSKAKALNITLPLHLLTSNG